MILVCGEALYDVFVASEHASGFQLDARLGGSAFNCAVGVARLGREVGLLTGVSADGFGRKIVSALQTEDVATRFLVEFDKATTLALVTLNEDGSARYHFHGDGAADRALREADLPDLNGSRALVFGCFSILTEPTGSTFLALARTARADRIIALDPNVRTTVEPDLDRWRERVAAFAACADVIKASAEDLTSLYPAASTERTAEDWLGAGTKLVVVTAGADGARAWFRDGTVAIPARPAAVIDTVGAGDSFLAALLAGLDETGRLNRGALTALSAADAEKLLRFCTAAAAHTCAHRGADLPRRQDLVGAEDRASDLPEDEHAPGHG